jgi:hypothetical protein
MPDTGRKKCGKCKRIMLRSCFTKDKSTTDGLAPNCKGCKREYEREYIKASRQQRKFDGVEIAPATGIANESQIDSLIREMAELQVNINCEKALCEARISLVKKYTDEIIEPSASHQIALQTMLLDFLKKRGTKTFSRKYRFGVVSFSRGKLRLCLYADLARQEMEKP